MVFLLHRFFLPLLLLSLIISVFLPLGVSVRADELTNPEGTTTSGSFDGTNDDDTMTNYGTVGSHINAMDGDDTIINYGTVGDDINGQEGNDTIINYGTADYIIAFDGNDTITNHGIVNNSIYGQDGDDTITIYGTVQQNVLGGSGTDSLTLEDGSYIGSDITTFEFITINGETTLGDLNLAGLDTMTITLSSNATPVTVNDVTNTTGTLNVEITQGAFIDGQTVNLFSTGSEAGFTSETVTDSSAILSFTISNAQITVSRDTTFDALVSGSSNTMVTFIAALFEENANTATGDLAQTIGTLNFMSQSELESVFNQTTRIYDTTQAMTQGVRMGTGAVMARMGNVLASRGTSSNPTGFTPLPAMSPDHETLARSLENLRFMEHLSAMLSNTSSVDYQAGLAGPDLCASDFASQNIMLAPAGELGPSLNIGTGDTSGAWFRALGRWSHQKEQTGGYGYSGQTQGLAGGVDSMFSENILTGFFGSWAQSDLEYDDPGESEADGNNFQLGLYSAWGPGAWFYETALAATYGDWDSSRRIVSDSMDETAVSKQNAYGSNLSLTLGRDCAAKAFIITPVAGAEYTFSHEKGYTETGAGGWNRSVDSVDRHFLRSMVGLKIQRPLELENKTLSLVPAIKAQWLHEFLGQTSLYYTFADLGSATMDSLEADRDTARLGASLTLAQSNRYSGYISYETDITETYMDHTLAAGFRTQF